MSTLLYWYKSNEHLAVASQGVLEHLCELRVAIGHVFVLVRERRHHIMERRERAVDVFGLLRARPAVSALLYSVYLLYWYKRTNADTPARRCRQ